MKLTDCSHRMFPIDGATSEGVLGAFVRDDAFLWASDRVQDVETPTLYVAELWRAARRNGIEPRCTSGPHLRGVPWATIDALARNAR